MRVAANLLEAASNPLHSSKIEPRIEKKNLCSRVFQQTARTAADGHKVVSLSLAYDGLKGVALVDGDEARDQAWLKPVAV
jgi:hypothetical protein